MNKIINPFQNCSLKLNFSPCLIFLVTIFILLFQIGAAYMKFNWGKYIYTIFIRNCIHWFLSYVFIYFYIFRIEQDWLYGNKRYNLQINILLIVMKIFIIYPIFQVNLHKQLNAIFLFLYLKPAENISQVSMIFTFIGFQNCILKKIKIFTRKL